jgi:uncharacterized protein (DUF58 family)
MKELNVDFSKNISKFSSAMRKRMLVKTVFYKKVFKGKGVEFDSYRRYTPYDDASLIDWKASMKANNPLVKQYVEERDLKIFFIVDVGDNMVFGSGDKLKNETAAEISATLAHLIVYSGDSVGFAMYSDKIKKIRMFNKGKKQFYIFARNLQNPEIYGGVSDLKQALGFLLPYIKEASAVFIISDFIKIDEECKEILKRFSRKYETIGIMVRDIVDIQLPDLNKEVVVEDIYSGRQLLINPHIIRQKYEKYAYEQRQETNDFFRKIGADLFEIYTGKDFVKPLAEFLKSRVSRKRYIVPKK